VLDRQRVAAVLFDLDGTLIDTDNQMVARLARILLPAARLACRSDATPLSRRLVMSAEGPSNVALGILDRLGLDAPLGRLGERLSRRPAVSTVQASAVPGVPEMLAAVRARYPVALVTTRGRKMVLALLAAAGLSEVFTVIATREDTFRMKPHPAPVQLAARLLGFAPEHCLMVGDTTVDILAGKRAGAQTAGVLCGFGERAELERAGAGVVLEDTSGLAALLGLE
jgi:N-acetyl-D-muramate 6-phosphate phosphatase